jgi:hypothetical protein
MRLLQLRNDEDISLVEYFGTPPPYAILSHTWGADDDEVTFKDLSEARGKDKKGYIKLLFCAQQAALHGLEYFCMVSNISGWILVASGISPNLQGPEIVETSAASIGRHQNYMLAEMHSKAAYSVLMFSSYTCISDRSIFRPKFQRIKCVALRAFE